MRKPECVKGEESSATYPGRPKDKLQGTISGYIMHLEQDQLPCSACLLARVKFDLEEYKQERLQGITRDPSSDPDGFWEDFARSAVLSVVYNVERFLEEREESILLDIEERSRNKENKLKASSRRRRITRKGLISSMPQENYALEEIAERDGWDCYLCESELVDGHVSVDHVIPVSDPDCPGDILSNVKLVHDVCNSKKGAKRVEILKLPFPAPIY